MERRLIVSSGRYDLISGSPQAYGVCRCGVRLDATNLPVNLVRASGLVLRPEDDIARVVRMAEPSLYGFRSCRDGRDAAETVLNIERAGINSKMRAFWP
jgi:hypothetical protein